MKNLEIKVRYPDLDLALQMARSLGARDAGESHDADTYFRVLSGRLKLRQSEGASQGTLIHYERPDQPKSRYAEYHLAKVGDPVAMKVLLDAALGTLVTVTKSRRLLLYKATRIHLDRVEGLGNFVELETVVQGHMEEQARREHELVKRTMGLDRKQTLAVSYSDLLLT